VKACSSPRTPRIFRAGRRKPQRDENPPPLKACRFDSDLGHSHLCPVPFWRRRSTNSCSIARRYDPSALRSSCLATLPEPPILKVRPREVGGPVGAPCCQSPTSAFRQWGAVSNELQKSRLTVARRSGEPALPQCTRPGPRQQTARYVLAPRGEWQQGEATEAPSTRATR
jgi:hypothetical protein